VTTLLVYAVTLVVAVLISDRAHRTVLSTAVLFLVAGAAMGLAGGAASNRIIHSLADLALVAVLFTDGLRIPLRDLRAAWHLPGRALLLGFPLTLAGTALAARFLVGVSWPAALLLGAALAPTDPVFASAIIGREEVPGRLRHLLNVESGLNDGLALPFVVAFIAWTREREIDAGSIAWQLALGVALGIAVPWLAVRLERSRFFAASEQYRPIGVFSVGLLVYALALGTHANEFLASFAAGIVLATVAPRAHEVFGAIGESATELLKLAALLVFGSLLSPSFLAELPLGGWVFAVVALFAVRPLAIAIALMGADLSGREKIVAAWFGPKGFASVVYGLLVSSTRLPHGDLVFHLIAITTALSILLHSSTDVPVAKWFERRPML
jgi:sodium/hydrogen antiporter